MMASLNMNFFIESYPDATEVLITASVVGKKEDKNVEKIAKNEGES